MPTRKLISVDDRQRVAAGLLDAEPEILSPHIGAAGSRRQKAIVVSPRKITASSAPSRHASVALPMRSSSGAGGSVRSRVRGGTAVARRTRRTAPSGRLWRRARHPVPRPSRGRAGQAGRPSPIAEAARVHSDSCARGQRFQMYAHGLVRRRAEGNRPVAREPQHGLALLLDQGQARGRPLALAASHHQSKSPCGALGRACSRRERFGNSSRPTGPPGTCRDRSVACVRPVRRQAGWVRRRARRRCH